MPVGETLDRSLSLYGLVEILEVDKAGMVLMMPERTMLVLNT